MNLTFKEQFIPKILDGTKECTIRADKKRRWKERMKIHFRTPRFSKNSRCFAEGKVCMLRKITIDTKNETAQVQGVTYPLTVQDGRLENLAKRDGFESVREFLDFFRKNLKEDDNGIFEGVLIVWYKRDLKIK